MIFVSFLGFLMLICFFNINHILLDCSYFSKLLHDLSPRSVHIFSCRKSFEKISCNFKNNRNYMNPYYMDKFCNLNKTIHLRSSGLRIEQYTSNDTYEHIIFVNMSTI